MQGGPRLTAYIGGFLQILLIERTQDFLSQTSERGVSELTESDPGYFVTFWTVLAKLLCESLSCALAVPILQFSIKANTHGVQITNRFVYPFPRGPIILDFR